MRLFGMPDGGYRVSLLPSTGGQTELQLFDIAGRCVFTKMLESVKSPMSFTIPENNIPNSPFIAKVRNGAGSYVQKQVPVR